MNSDLAGNGEGGIRDPEQLEAEGAPTSAEISAQTTLGAVHLTVADLDRSVSFYEDAVGLGLLERTEDRAALGVGARVLIVLVEEPGALPALGYTGLYHVALLLPRRVDLARWLLHAAEDRVPLVGMSDHFVSEAIYLADPDEHGLEIYWDRPREHWEGQVAERMTTVALDLDGLLGELPSSPPAKFDGLSEGAIVGHVHLRVAAIDETVAFYRDVLGFGLMAALGSQAAFLSAGGYHHHIGANIWESAGASPPPAGSASLRHVTVELPGSAERDSVLARVAEAGQKQQDLDGNPSVRDPSGNVLVLTVGR
ncbi:MAG: VOC family protein [Solirubrobacterales bacterium]